MEKKFQIQEELASISPLLSKMKKIDNVPVSEEYFDSLLEETMEKVKTKETKVLGFNTWKKIAIAASFFICISATIFLIFQNKSKDIYSNIDSPANISLELDTYPEEELLTYLETNTSEEVFAEIEKPKKEIKSANPKDTIEKEEKINNNVNSAPEYIIPIKANIDEELDQLLNEIDLEILENELIIDDETNKI